MLLIQHILTVSKDLAKGTILDKILRHRSWKYARNCKYDGYQGALASMVYNFFEKRTGSRVSANESHKPVSEKITRRKGYKRSKDNRQFVSRFS